MRYTSGVAIRSLPECARILFGVVFGFWLLHRASKPDRSDFIGATRDRSIYLPGGRVTAVNDIDYIDVDAAPQTLTGPTSQTPGTDYQEDLTNDEKAYLYPAQNGYWPNVDDLAVNAVMVDYQAGWDDPSEIPESIRYAVKFKVGDMFTIRDTADAGNRSSLIKAAENCSTHT